MPSAPRDTDNIDGNMSFIKRIATSVLGGKPEEQVLEELQGADVPVTDAPCRTCTNPCEEGHVEYTRMTIDTISDMRGSVKPYHRQVVISTGKADWPKEVTDVSGSLAQHLSNVTDKLGGGKKQKKKVSLPKNGAATDEPTDSSGLSSSPAEPSTGKVAGVFSAEGASRTSILNGSHHSVSEDDAHETVLVLPDYVAVTNVPATADGAESLWLHALAPEVPRAGAVRAAQGLQTWTLPYHCLILLCSHKQRDQRCHIASKRLEEDFMGTLQSEGWHVDTDVDDLSHTGPPLEDFQGSDEEREKEVIRRLKALDNETSKRALILKNSHIGGHKFAGNVILYFPQGSSVWYGRVSSHEVQSVVKNTILAGKILPPLLRGGLNISRPGHVSIFAW